MSSKAKGARREREVRDHFLAKGYEVMKAGGSLGIYDLIAMNLDSVILIQVKSNRWPRTPEMDVLTEDAKSRSRRVFTCLIVRRDDVPKDDTNHPNAHYYKVREWKGVRWREGNMKRWRLK